MSSKNIMNLDGLTAEEAYLINIITSADPVDNVVEGVEKLAEVSETKPTKETAEIVCDPGRPGAFLAILADGSKIRVGKDCAARKGMRNGYVIAINKIFGEGADRVLVGCDVVKAVEKAAETPKKALPTLYVVQKDSDGLIATGADGRSFAISDDIIPEIRNGDVIANIAFGRGGLEIVRCVRIPATAVAKFKVEAAKEGGRLQSLLALAA